MTPQSIPCGFTYEVLTRRKSDHSIVSREVVHNRVPEEGLNLMCSVVFKAAPAPAALYVGLYSGSHAPSGQETAATFLTQVQEVTDYDDATRKAFNPGVVAGGGVSNEQSLARFSFGSEQTVNGVFISTASAKGANTGALLSVVRLPTARKVDPAFYLEILTGFQFVSI